MSCAPRRGPLRAGSGIRDRPRARVATGRAAALASPRETGAALTVLGPLHCSRPSVTSREGCARPEPGASWWASTGSSRAEWKIQTEGHVGPTSRNEEQDRRARRKRAVRTYSPTPADVQRNWRVIDAEGHVLGRLATEAAVLLRGKHKPQFAPHLDLGDHVVVVNAAKVVLTSAKAEDKRWYRHSGYPGGIRSTSYAELLATHPEVLVRRAVRGMLPRGPLGRAQLKKLKVYSGPSHPHAAQSPVPHPLERARRASS